MDKKFIFLDIARIEQSFSSPAFSLAWALSELGYEVIHINNPLTFKDLIFSKKITSYRLFSKTSLKEYGFKSIYILGILPINWIPKGFIYIFFLKVNNKILNYNIRKILKGDEKANLLFVNSYLPFYTIDKTTRKKFNIKKTIYQSIDHIENSKYIKKHGVYLEKTISKKYDTIITTSTKLQEKLKYNNNNNNNNKTFLLPNACNYKLFRSILNKNKSKPEELKSIKGKIVGFFGYLDTNRIDVDLIIYLANNLPKVNFIFIGESDLDKGTIKRIKQHKNIIFLGPKPYAILPNYLKHFDCCIIPYLVNELTSYIYPLKINEYLTEGKNVVATNFSKDISSFSPYINVADNKESFCNYVFLNLEPKSSVIHRKRIEYAKLNSWENRANSFIKILDNND